MGFPPLHRECAVVCDARPRSRSITIHFVVRSSVAVTHTSTDDVTVQVINRDGKTKPLRPASVMSIQRLLIIVLAYGASLAKRVSLPGARVRVERRIRNGVETAEAWECEVVSVLTTRMEEP